MTDPNHKLTHRCTLCGRGFRREDLDEIGGSLIHGVHSDHDPEGPCDNCPIPCGPVEEIQP